MRGNVVVFVYKVLGIPLYNISSAYIRYTFVHLSCLYYILFISHTHIELKDFSRLFRLLIQEQAEWGIKTMIILD